MSSRSKGNVPASLRHEPAGREACMYRMCNEGQRFFFLRRVKSTLRCGNFFLTATVCYLYLDAYISNGGKLCSLNIMKLTCIPIPTYTVLFLSAQQLPSIEVDILCLQHRENAMLERIIAAQSTLNHTTMMMLATICFC